MSTSTPSSNVFATVHRIGVVLCVLTFTLIVWGGHVNTTRSGMAFPDWPTSNLAPMVTYAPSEWMWQSDRFWEHGHRLLASVVGAVTVLLGISIIRSIAPSSRPSRGVVVLLGVVLTIIATAIVGMNSMPGGIMETFMVALAIMLVTFLMRALRQTGEQRLVGLAIAAFLAVCLQGAFGGYTVRNNLPDWTSTTHGMLAQFFFMMVIGITLLTSRAWQQAEAGSAPYVPVLRGLVTSTWIVTIVQFLLGALTRHTDAWGVSVSWPQWDDTSFFPASHLLHHGQVLIHLLHRTMAYVVAIMVLAQWVLVMRNRRTVTQIVMPATINAVLVLVQIALGAMILWSARGELATTLHVATGVLLLVFNTITMLTTQRMYAAHGPSVAGSTIIAGQGSR